MCGIVGYTGKHDAGPILLAGLIVQRKELSRVPQPLFLSRGVARAGDAVSPLAPIGDPDRLPLGLLGRSWGEDDLQQSPGIRQRQAVLGFFSHPPRLQDQEPHRQHDQSHVVVKAAPAPDLIVVQPQFLFATQKTVLDGPAGMPGLRNSNSGQLGLALLR